MQKSGYWPATVNFCTIYDEEVFVSFEDLKMAAPGLSRFAFIRMLDMKTVHYGRTQLNLKKDTESLQEPTMKMNWLQMMVTDVQEWAHTTTVGDSDVAIQTTRNTIEELSLCIKQRQHRLYRHTVNPWNLPDDGIQGLQCVLKRKLHQLRAHQGTVKTSYQTIDIINKHITVEECKYPSWP